MKAVVTGASGFIGRSLASYLDGKGVNVVRLDREAGENVVAADVSKRDAIRSYLDSDTTVFHLAASADVAASVADPRHDLEHTFGSAFEILETARATGARVVIPSTASVCGQVNTLPLSEGAFTRPVSPYAAGKAAIEAYASAYNAAYGLDVRIVRLFSVYGPGMTRFAIHDIVRKIEQNPQRVSILGDGNQIRDYLHIKDAVRGLVFVASHGEAGETYNVASGEPVRLYDLAEMIAEVMGHPDILIEPTGESFAGDTPRWYADISKVAALGFKPQVTLRDGLTETIRWLTGAAAPVEAAAR